MKRSIFSLLSAICLLTALSLFTACQKSNSGSKGSTTNPLGGTSGSTDYVKSITTVAQTPNGTDTGTISYTYDDQNRCTAEISGDTTYYTYSANTMTSTEGMYVTTYYLNGSGAADSAHFVVSSPGYSLGGYTFPPTTSTTVFRYTYNGSGYMSRFDMYQQTPDGDSLEDTRLFTFTSGNLTLVDDVTAGMNTTFPYTNQTTSTAGTAPDGFLGADLGVSGSSLIIFGKPNTNLVASIPSAVGTMSYTTNFTYTLDGQNRISTTTEKGLPGDQSGSAILYYTYY